MPESTTGETPVLIDEVTEPMEGKWTTTNDYCRASIEIYQLIFGVVFFSDNGATTDGSF